MNAAIAEPRAEVARDGTEDRQLRDPDRQDRRGHRAQGQGHQHDPAGDRRRHLRRRRRHRSASVTIGSTDGGAVDEARRRIELILDPPTAEVGADLHGPGREHHQVRCVRQHPPGPRRPGPHLQARAAASASTGSRTCSTSATRSRSRVDDIDPNGKVSLTPIGDGDDGVRRRPRAAASGGARRARPRSSGSDGSSSASARRVVSFEDVVRRRGPRGVRRPRPAAAAAPSGGGRGGSDRRRRPWSRGRVAAAVAERGRPSLSRSRIERTAARLGLRVVTERDARGPLGVRSASGSASARATSPTTLAGVVALPRAPAVQGHRTRARPATSPQASTASAAT